VDVLVPAEDQHHDQRPEHPPALRHRIPYQAEPTEVDLGRLTRLGSAMRTVMRPSARPQCFMANRCSEL
jgi:hypothetical protein